MNIFGQKHPKTVTLTFRPLTAEEHSQRESERQRVMDEIENSGLLHENKETHTRNGFLFEVIQETRWGRATSYFTYFLYDCRETALSALEGAFLDCHGCDSREQAVNAANKHIDWLLSLGN